MNMPDVKTLIEELERLPLRGGVVSMKADYIRMLLEHIRKMEPDLPALQYSKADQ
ncbi:MAG: hypothetical protein V1721_01390 [Pseudomonadota bacterium]